MSTALKVVAAAAALLVVAAAAGIAAYQVMTVEDGEKQHTLESVDEGGEDAAAALAEGDERDGVAEGDDVEVPEGGEIGDEDEIDVDTGDTEEAAAPTGTDLRARSKSRRKAGGSAGARDGSVRAKAQKVNSRKKRGPSLSECRSKVGGVTRHSDTHYTLSNGFMARYLHDTTRGQKQGGVGWAKDSAGSRTGARLKGLRCAPRAAGFRNKDVVAEVAGYAINTTANAWLAYREVKKGESFEVKVLRKGAPMIITYDVGSPTAPAAADAAAGGEGSAAEGSAAEGSAAEGEATAPEGAEAPAEGAADGSAGEGAGE